MDSSKFFKWWGLVILMKPTFKLLWSALDFERPLFCALLCMYSKKGAFKNYVEIQKYSHYLMLNCCYSFGLGELYWQLDLMFNFTDINFTGIDKYWIGSVSKALEDWKTGFVSDKGAKIFKKCDWKFMGVPYKCTSYCLEEREKRVFSLWFRVWPEFGCYKLLYYTATQLIEIISQGAF